MGNDHIMDADEERYRDDLVIPGRDPVPECDTPIWREDSFMRGDDKRYIEIPKLKNPGKFGDEGVRDYSLARDVWLYMFLAFLFMFLYELVRRSRVAIEARLGECKEIYKEKLEKDKKKIKRKVRKNPWIEKYDKRLKKEKENENKEG